MSVLLLDMTYEPIRIIDWQDAMTLIVTGDAEVVEEIDQPVRSAMQTWNMPSVIRQLKKFKRRGEVKFSRLNIYMRDNWTCQYCRQKMRTQELTFDHVLPRAQGGKTSWTNIVTACRPCNSRKDNRTPEQAKMRLLRQPEQPKWLPAQTVIRLKTIPKQWEPYIDVRSVAYWTEELETG